MATPELPQRSGLDLQGVSSLAGLFLGKDSSQSTQNSGGTSTTGSKTTSQNVSQDAVNAIVKSILEGSQGLAAVAKGQKQAGLYNSSTNTLLANDLIARAAAEGAKLNKSETTSVNENTVDTRASTTQSKVAAPIKPSTAVTALGGLQLLGSITGSKMGKGILSKLGIGNSGAANSASASGAPAPINDGTSGVSSDISSSAPVATMDATGNTQAVSALNSNGLANNPSGFIAGSNEQVVNSLTDSYSGDYLGAGDLGFDQSADFSDIVGDVGSGIIDGITDAAGGVTELGGVTGDWGVDPNTIDYGGDFDLSDMFDFAEGGLVTPHGNERLVRKYQKGGYVNLAAEKAFASGGDDDNKSNNSGDIQRTRDSGTDFFTDGKNQKAVSNDPRSATETEKPKSLNVRIMERLKGKVPGFAEGGIVDITNTGLRAKQGPEDDLNESVSGAQIVSSIQNRRGTTAANTGGTKVSTSSGKPTNMAPMNTRRMRAFTGPNLGFESTEGTPTSAPDVGTPESNQAAINGAIGMAATMALGIPGFVAPMAMNALGIPNTNMNPISNLIGVVTGMIGPDGMAAAAQAAADANNEGAPTNSDNAAAVANSIAEDNNMDPLDALIGIVDDGLSPEGMMGGSNDGTSGEGGGIGGSGNSAGDGNAGDGGNGTSGDGSGSDGGTASAKRGGMIRGPGTSTSDSIDAKLSDGEYVIRASVVDHYGKDFFDRLNESISVK